MKRMNHRVIMYLNFGKMGFDVGKPNKEDEETTPFDEQLALLRKIHLKKEANYDQEREEEK